MAMDVSKGDVLEGFQKLIGSVMIPALQKQEVCCNFLPENNLQINSHIYQMLVKYMLHKLIGLGLENIGRQVLSEKFMGCAFLR